MARASRPRRVRLILQPCAIMAARMRPDIVSTLVLAVVALVLAVLAYTKDPGLPLLGVRNGASQAMIRCMPNSDHEVM